jgi:hypothetical protein
LLFLGAASLVVTGDEEGENILNIPVRKASINDFPTPAKTTLMSLRGKHRKTTTPSFPHDPDWMYSLDENATLRVGVRVVPLPTTNASENNPEPHAPWSQKEMLIELEDESLLTAHLHKIGGYEGNKTKSSVGIKSDDAAAERAMKGGKLTPSILCAPVGLNLPCTEEFHKYIPAEMKRYISTAQSDRSPHDKKQKSKQSSKYQSKWGRDMKQGVASVHLPGSLLSSLSASSDGTDPVSRSSHSCASFADSHLRSVQRMIEANLLAMQLKLGTAASTRAAEANAISAPSNDLRKMTDRRTLEV